MRQFRIIPFKSKDKNTQHYTLVLEWLNKAGKVFRDQRHQMTAPQFEQLKHVVLKTDDTVATLVTACKDTLKYLEDKPMPWPPNARAALYASLETAITKATGEQP